MNNGLESFMSGAKKIWPAQLLKDGVLNTRLIWLGILGIVLLVIGGVLDNQPAKLKNEVPGEIQRATPVVNRSYEEILEGKLANLLSQVKGAGAVTVSITLENSSTQEHAKNVVKESKSVQEKDTSGGIRTTVETKESEQILLSKENGSDHPVMVQELKPTIKGVLVVAEGAYDSNVKANLTQAVEAGLGVPSYKITVLPQRK
jgi:stage III sporulation protein AG